MLLLKTKKENEKLKKIYHNTTVWGFWCIFFQMFFLLNIYVYLYIYISSPAKRGQLQSVILKINYIVNFLLYY